MAFPVLSFGFFLVFYDQRDVTQVGLHLEGNRMEGRVEI